MADLSLRPLSMEDAPEVLLVMRKAAGGLSRQPHEMDLAWAEEAIAGALAGGVAIGAWEEAKLAGVIKASRMPSLQFEHVLWDLTVAVDPEFQRRGIARGLFEALFSAAEKVRPRGRRIELVVREDLTHAIRLYESLGFRIEGRFEGRFRLPDGRYEADVPMARFL